MPNYGVTDRDGKNFPSKAALKRAIAAGEQVRVYSTSAFTPVLPLPQLTDLTPVDVIVGPDPFTKRDWYGNVKEGRDGKLRVV